MIGVKIDTPSIKRLRDLFGNTGVVNVAITQRFMYEIKRQFESVGGNYGMKWPPYSRLTIYARQVRGKRGTMLSTLYSQIRTRHGKTFAMVYSDSDILSYHNFGTRGGYQIPKEWKPGKYIAYPHPDAKPSVERARGVLNRMKFGNWAIIGHPVRHPGLWKRRIFPTIEEATVMAREVVEYEIGKKIRDIAIRKALRKK